MSAGCAAPQVRIDGYAAERGMTREVIQGDGYRHVVYRKAATRPSARLHLYLEGDGSPWLRRHIPAADPTPRNPLALRLMARDEAESFYLGRPCYHGFAAEPGCGTANWTSGRYSPDVVDSLSSVIGQIVKQRQVDQIVLIGYSGGGALAVLLAPRVAETRAVLTVAGNLDIDAWTALHGYTPLRASLNPIDMPPLAGSILQTHVVGSEDEVVPPSLTAGYAARRPGAELRILPGVDHRCCWEDLWPEILRILEQQLDR
jgi:pimeloyl-ACP methyl ester carboxylesterase